MARQNLLIHTRRYGNVSVIDLMGEVDAETAGQFEDALVRACNDSLRAIILNLDETNRLDSSGVRAILMGSRKVQRQGVSVSLLSPHGSVRQILGAARGAMSLPVFDREIQAIEAASKWKPRR